MNVEAHLDICPPCQEVLAQWQTVVDLAGRLKTDDVDALPDPVRAYKDLVSFAPTLIDHLRRNGMLHEGMSAEVDTL